MNSRPCSKCLIIGVTLWFCLATPLWGQSEGLADVQAEWPTWEQWRRTLFLQDFNTRVVVIGTGLLGMAAGLVGSFTLLRKRALIGDALAHATLPGIGIAFIVVGQLGGDGKSMLFLLSGAAITGLMGMAAIFLIRRHTKLKDDAALGIVLSVFFGAGVAILGLIQQMQAGHAAGLESFIYGKTASMILSDAWLIGGTAAVCLAVVMVLFKELKLLCFDESYAASRGFPVLLLDVALMGLVVVVTIVGLQAVGLVLVIALMVIPAASARFWTEELGRLAIVSACIGALSGVVGSTSSALFSRLPSGAMIVLIAAGLFLSSMLFGTRRGVLVRTIRRRQLNAKIDRQHLLRGIFELTEKPSNAILSTAGDVRNEWKRSRVTLEDLMKIRSWSKSRLQRTLNLSMASGMVARDDEAKFSLTEKGKTEAIRLVREHRLWEIYLIAYADVAPSRVDRDADAIEHVLEPELIRELESQLSGQMGADRSIPPDPHAIAEIEFQKSVSKTRSLTPSEEPHHG